MLKKIIFLSVVFLLCLTGCSNKVKTVADIKSKGVITVITNAVFPPFEYFKLDEVKGIDVDIAKEVAKDLGVELEILDMNFDGVIAAIASGKGDFAAAGITINEKRKKVIDFSHEYITVPQSLVTMADSKINNVSDLKGKNIGTQIGTTSDTYIDNEIKDGFLKGSEAQVVKRKEYLDLVIDLKNGRLDVIALDGLIARKLVEKNSRLKFFDRDSESYVLAVKKGNNELLKEINKTIDRLLKQGKIIDFYNQHINLNK